MKSKLLIIPFVALVTAVLGSFFTTPSINSWYKTINLPLWTPSGLIIGFVWTILYILTTVSALIVFSSSKKSNVKKFPLIGYAFLTNAFLNVLWSFLFFNRHLLVLAGFEAVLLGLSVLVLIYLTFSVSKLASYLLLPYFLWVSFATYLTFVIAGMNK